MNCHSVCIFISTRLMTKSTQNSVTGVTQHFCKTTAIPPREGRKYLMLHVYRATKQQNRVGRDNCSVTQVYLICFNLKSQYVRIILYTYRIENEEKMIPNKRCWHITTVHYSPNGKIRTSNAKTEILRKKYRQNICRM